MQIVYCNKQIGNERTELEIMEAIGVCHDNSAKADQHLSHWEISGEINQINEIKENRLSWPTKIIDKGEKNSMNLL